MTVKDYIYDRSNLQFNKYVPISQKEAILEGDGETQGLIEFCLIEKENGMKLIDVYSKEVLLSALLVKLYTNIELSDEEQTEELDKIISSGLVGAILKEVPDARRLSDMFEYRLKQEIEMTNTLTAVIATSLSKIVKKIPDDINAKTIDKWIKAVPKMMEKISPENQEIMKGLVAKKE